MNKELVDKATKVAKTASKSKLVWGVVIVGLVLLVITGVVGFIMYKRKNNNNNNKEPVKLTTESNNNLPTENGSQGENVDASSVNNGKNASV